MSLDLNVQRELDADVRRVEEDARRLIVRVARDRGGDQREWKRNALAKLEVFISELEDGVFDQADDASAGGREREIREIHRMSDDLIAKRAQLDRKRREIRREKGDLAFDRRAHDLGTLESELAALDPA
jgi:hypothetical protein